MTYLKSKGMSRIEALGQTFSTDFHEAVAQLPAQDPEFKNKVIDVVLQGYTLNGVVVRYAKVVVGV
jgi:molecular chaperone GrpE